MISIGKKTISKEKTNLKYISLFLSVILISIVLFMHPKIVSSGVKSGLDCCINVLIPSMFPFMIVSSMISLSGIEFKLKKFLGNAIKFLLYLPASTAPAIIISMFGGYPIGAYAVKNLYKRREINKEQLNRMMCFCVNSGPAFIISMVGESLLGDHKVGISMFLIQVLFSLSIGIICGIIARIKKVEFYQADSISKTTGFDFGNLIIDSCDATCKSMIKMCSLIILFFGIISTAKGLGVIDFISQKISVRFGIESNVFYTVLISLIEVTHSCITAKNFKLPIWVYSWALGFGGICTHMQIASELKGLPFKYKKFLLTRIMNGAITAILSGILIKSPEKIVPAFAPMQSYQVSITSSTNAGSLLLIILCLVFLRGV